MSEITEKRNYDETLRQRLIAYRVDGRDRPLTMSTLGRELGISATRVNKYLLGKPEGNVKQVEDAIADLLKAAATRKVSDVDAFDTNATRLLCATYEQVRKTNDVGLVSGPAGIGKSMSIRMYTDRHPTTIAVSVPRWQRSDGGVTSLLFAAIDPRDWPGNEPRAHYMVRRLRNSNRLIIVDNAQRMTDAARQWLFDLHDETGCPMVLIGNPEVLQAIRRSDQQFSRIGINQEITLDASKIETYARQMIDALVSDPQDGLYDLATAVAEERGHLRALRKQIMLMLDLADTKRYAGDQLRAFYAAHKLLVRDYDL